MPEELDKSNILKPASIEVWKGIGLTALLHLIQVLGVWIMFMPAWFIGITQLCYIIPVALYFNKKGRPGIVQGLIIGAAITFLLNAACFGYLMMGNIRIGG
jgi:hypothetical protein